jgi:hypothetical protein
MLDDDDDDNDDREEEGERKVGEELMIWMCGLSWVKLDFDKSTLRYETWREWERERERDAEIAKDDDECFS